MPAPRAYGPEEVIARGLALEQSGTVTPMSLHHALGCRGDRNTAFATWSAFVEHRDRVGAVAARPELDGLSPALTALVTEGLKAMVSIAQTAAAETTAVHDRRAGAHVQTLDAVLAEREALAGEIAELRRDLAARPAAQIAGPGDPASGA